VKKTTQTLLAVMAGVLIGSGVSFVREGLASRDTQPAAYEPAVSAHDLLEEVKERVSSEYVESLPDGRLEQAAVEGVIASLDPHSAFLDAAAYDEMRVNTSGSYTGIGIEVSAVNDRVTVVAPIEGSPADRAGVLTGDVLLSVDGIAVNASRLNDAIERLRGFPGSHVRVAVAREGEAQPLNFDLERSEVHVRTVRAEALPGGYGYARITQFSDSTPSDLDDALTGLGGTGRQPRLRGLVLDLRGNPGGVLEAAATVADEFLDSGLIVRGEGRTPESRFEIDATAGDVLRGAPLVVLIDGGSASGAEIVAGALRDHDRATLMGERTFGKGSVQTVIPLRHGQALKLTTSRYYTPSGTSIHERGLEPDYVIAGARPTARASERSAVTDPAVQAALQYLRDRGLRPQIARMETH
jgi:carboxyl-terminal processing protease